MIQLKIGMWVSLLLTLVMWSFTIDSTDIKEDSDSSKRFTKHPAGTAYAHQGFWEYVPAGYDSDKKHPVLFFFHGFGENGDGSEAALDSLLNNGPTHLISSDKWPLHKGDDMIVLAPQNFRVDQCHSSEDMRKFILWAIDKYKVDESRVYLTGLSCGGFGIYDYLANYVEDSKVAAAVPICGYGIKAIEKSGCKMAKIPLWAFHGDADSAVGVEGSSKPIDFLNSCENVVEAKLTIYPGVDHDSWTQTYDMSSGHNIYDWLLSYSI